MVTKHGKIYWLSEDSMAQKQAVLQSISDYYLQSDDFNGMPIRTLRAQFKLSAKRLLLWPRVFVDTGLGA